MQFLFCVIINYYLFRYQELLSQRKLLDREEQEPVQTKSLEERPSRHRSLSVSVSDEVNAALLEIDLILDIEEEQYDRHNPSLSTLKIEEKRNRSSNKDGPSIVSPLTRSISSENSRASTPIIAECNPRISSPINKNIKDIIDQMQRRSLTPSPPLSPRSPIDNSANIKDIINKLQSTPNHPTTDNLPLTRSTLSSERISIFTDNSKKEVKKDVHHKIKKIKSPFLAKDYQTNEPLVHPRQLKRSVSHGDMVRVIDEENDSAVDKISSDTVLLTEVTENTQDSVLSHDNQVTDEQVMTITLLDDNEKIEEDELLDNEVCPEINENDDFGQISVFGEATEFMQKSFLRRPLRRAGGPMERKRVARRTTPPSSMSMEGKDETQECNVGSSDVVMSEDELELTLTNSSVATPTDKIRSKSTLPNHSLSMNAPNPRVQSQAKNLSRRAIKSVGDHYEIDKESVTKEPSLIEQSSELTMGVSIDGLYHINYQLRHSMDVDTSDRFVNEKIVYYYCT